MSQHNETIICPNCNSEATGNYCSQCGQETHLHKETFWGLVVHFFGHYFHYDSKLWQTLKVLWLEPGKLTVAYWKKQRKRYIPPPNLYLFISAVYFLIAFTFPNHRSAQSGKVVETVTVDGSGRQVDIDSLSLLPADSLALANKQTRYFIGKAEKIAKEHNMPASKYLQEKVGHTLPKLMFFMIPVLAWLLKIRFGGRRELYFVDHAIFALHIHCFWFSIWLIGLVHLDKPLSLLLDVTLIIIFSIYAVRAMVRAYDLRWFNATVTALGIALFYSMILGIVTVATLAAYFLLA